jgi:hypothetical protein
MTTDGRRARLAEQDPEQPAGWSRQKVQRLRYTHGISAWDWEALFYRQGRQCYICRTVPPDVRWVVDHDHGCCPGKRSCGKCVQGIACNGCNWAEAVLWAVRQRGGVDAVARLVRRSELTR